MPYIHNVRVNWFETKAERSDVYFAYEWKKHDVIKRYERMPIICVKETVFDNIETKRPRLPSTFMDKMRDESLKNNKPYSFAAVITDRLRVLAIETETYDFPLKKSRLTIKQEDEVLMYAEHEEQADVLLTYTHDIASKYSLSEKQKAGKTRRERELTYLLLDMFKSLDKKQNKAALRYFMSLYQSMISDDILGEDTLFLNHIKEVTPPVAHELIQNMLPLESKYQDIYDEIVGDSNMINAKRLNHISPKGTM